MKARPDVAAMLQDGATYRQIRAELSVSPNTIAATRRALGLPLDTHKAHSHPRLPPQRRDTIARMIHDGATYREIATTIGASNITIANVRRELGLPLREHRGDPDTTKDQ